MRIGIGVVTKGNVRQLKRENSSQIFLIGQHINETGATPVNHLVDIVKLVGARSFPRRRTVEA